MLKNILATSALATVIATGLSAQTAPTNETTIPAPVAPAAEGTQGGVAPDEAMTPPDVVEDETAPAAPSMATEDPATATQDPLAPQDPAVATDDPLAPQDPAMAGDMAPVDLATVSSEALIGTDIVTYDNQTIASIEDVIITDQGQVESLVARFGGFLGFGSERVLLTIDEVEVMQDADQEVIVRTNLTPESIEGRPAYEGEEAG